MTIDNIAIIVGVVFIVITLGVRLWKLKKNFLDKINLLVSIGYILLSYLSAILIVRMFYLAYLTISNKLSPDIINQNKEYIFIVWFIIALAGLVTYISLLIENKNG